MLRALDSYLRYVGPDALRLCADTEGEWRKLDETGWELTRRELREWESPSVTLEEGGPIGTR